MIPFSQQTTVGGYKCEEVASALQKEIRRGIVAGALFWATELDLSGFGEYVWKRLRIIASEDVGVADPMKAVEIRALYENWRDQRKKEDSRHVPERLFLVDAVMRLARATKSREVDNALVCFYEAKRQPHAVPDYALDRHTSRGRQRGRGWEHFFSEGAKIFPSAPGGDLYEPTARETRRDTGTQSELPEQKT